LGVGSLEWSHRDLKAGELGWVEQTLQLACDQNAVHLPPL
jgi:hypothetical protein